VSNKKVDETTVETNTTPDMMAMVEKLVQEALAKRMAELDEREAAIKAQEEELFGSNTPAPEPPVISRAWEEKREIFLPYATKGEEQFIFVAVNGRKYQVPRGRRVTVPLPLYERIKIMQEAESRTVEYRDSLPNEAFPVQTEPVRVG